MRRLGKFYMPTKLIMEGDASEIFSYMGFVPFRTEHLAYEDRFQYIGTSHIFEPLKEGQMVPEYELKIEHPAPEVDEIVVTAKAV